MNDKGISMDPQIQRIKEAVHNNIPRHCQDAVLQYVLRGINPGGFLQAVFSNDLAGAFGRADETNRKSLFEYVSFLYNEAPLVSWGSREKMKAWIERKGLLGVDATRET